MIKDLELLPAPCAAVGGDARRAARFLGAWRRGWNVSLPITRRLILYAPLHSAWFGNKMWQMDGFNLLEDAFLFLESDPLNG